MGTSAILFVYLENSYSSAVIRSVFTTANQCCVSVPLMTANVKTEPKLESMSDRLFLGVPHSKCF